MTMPLERLRALPGPVVCGAVVGIIQAVSPFGFWWLEPKTVYALGLTLIAAVYIGFSVAGVFVVVAAVSVSGSAWLLVLGLAGHGLKDLWQHRTQFVANTRWWPPFCFVVDIVAAALTAAVLWTRFDLHGLLR